MRLKKEIHAMKGTAFPTLNLNKALFVADNRLIFSSAHPAILVENPTLRVFCLVCLGYMFY